MKNYKKILEGVVNIINTTEKSDIGFANICTYISENCPELKERLLTDKDVETITLPESKVIVNQKSAWSEEDISKIDRLIMYFKGKDNKEFTEWFTLLKDRVQPQLKQEWGEEDEKMINKLIDFMLSGIDISKAPHGCVAWLKSIKDKVHLQPKQEWSEEDEKYLSNAIMYIYCTTHHGNIEKNEVIHWLKSIKDRYTWKPSDEQMRALNYVVNIMASSESPKENDYYFNVFKDLREQLKKLREK